MSDMSETTKQDDTSVEATPAGPRMWPAVIILLAYVTVLVLALRASSLMENVIGLAFAPVAAAIALAIWWLASKKIAMRERLASLGLTAVLLFVAVIPQGAFAPYLLMVALPAMMILVVVLLLVTSRMDWPRRRAIVIAGMVCCAGVFVALRMDTVGGNLTPVLSWRWSPTADELMGASESYPSGTATLPAEAGPEDWPGFRGQAREGILPGVTFATNWKESPPKEIWRRPIGLGFSSFAVVGDYLFTQEQRGTDELVVCYDARTGEEVWVNQVTARFDDPTGSGPRATPTFHKGRLYVQGATGVFQCLDASTGKVIWKRDLMEDTDAALPVWGFSSSPLIVGDLVIVFSGGAGGKSTAAYSLESGELSWCSGDGTHGYASGYLASIADVPQVLINSDIGVQSFVPDTGELLWEHRWLVTTNPRCVQPLVTNGDSVLIGTAAGMGTRSIHIEKEEDAWKVEEQWTTKRFKPYFNDFVHHEGYCYGFDGNRLTCIDLATGERQWRGGRYGGQALLLSDMGLLLVLSEKGVVFLVEASPEGANEIARFKAIAGKTWNHPVVAQGKLFVRNGAEAACFQLP